VVGSDGLWDNLYERHILSCLNPEVKGHNLEVPQQASDCLAKLAEKAGTLKDYKSPFAKNAQEQGLRFVGGKKDDVTVIVA
jgi:serine/threonine protein phosphatase PrpC